MCVCVASAWDVGFGWDNAQSAWAQKEITRNPTSPLPAENDPTRPRGACGAGEEQLEHIPGDEVFDRFGGGGVAPERDDAAGAGSVPSRTFSSKPPRGTLARPRPRPELLAAPPLRPPPPIVTSSSACRSRGRNAQTRAFKLRTATTEGSSGHDATPPPQWKPKGPAVCPNSQTTRNQQSGLYIDDPNIVGYESVLDRKLAHR